MSAHETYWLRSELLGHIQALEDRVLERRIRLFEAEAKAPELIEEARANLREAIAGYERLMGWT